MVRQILKWRDKKFEELDETNDKYAYAKAFGLGAIEGWIDASVLMYVPVLIACYYWKSKSKK